MHTLKTYQINNLSCFQDNPEELLSTEEIQRFSRLKLTPESKELAKYPTITDFWGYKYNWNNTDEGWYPYRRYLFLELLEQIMNQRKTVKKFTELGYKVMPIPTFLYETILDQKDEKSLNVENCKRIQVCFICAKILFLNYIPSICRQNL